MVKKINDQRIEEIIQTGAKGSPNYIGNYEDPEDGEFGLYIRTDMSNFNIHSVERFVSERTANLSEEEVKVKGVFTDLNGSFRFLGAISRYGITITRTMQTENGPQIAIYVGKSDDSIHYKGEYKSIDDSTTGKFELRVTPEKQLLEFWHP